jgi:hypothetical protein
MRSVIVHGCDWFCLATAIQPLSARESEGQDFGAVKPHIRLMFPRNNSVLKGDAIHFQWAVERMLDTTTVKIQKYQIQFQKKWETKKNTVYVSLDANDFTNGIRDINILRHDGTGRFFIKHGQYSWRIVVSDSLGEQFVSERWSFTIDKSRSTESARGWMNPNDLSFKYVHRVRTQQFVDFLRTVQPTAHLRSYSDISLGFVQKMVSYPYIELNERILLLSQVGMGFEIMTKLQVIQTMYFSIIPNMGISSAWYSTGLKSFSSNMNYIKIGCDLAIMPKGSILLHGSWVPTYQIRYSTVEKELRTFLGEGWEAGFTVTIPNSFVKTFKILGMEIDFEKIPFTFQYSRIKDKYTNSRMDMRTYGMGFLLK